jgi:O-glycosyl hydrolase
VLTTRMTKRPKALVLAPALVMVGALAGSPQAGPASARAAATGVVATIDGSRTYQKIAGFGASQSFGQAATIKSLPSVSQRRALDLLFSPSKGAGLTMLRNEIGATSGKTIEPIAPSSPSVAPNYVPLSSINDDQGQLWLAKRVKTDYGVALDVHADAWSAPPFMKTNKSVTHGGTLCGVPGCSSGDWRQAYANYLVQYAKDYAAAGVPLSYIGFENEANLAPTYDGMVMTPAQTVELHQGPRPEARRVWPADQAGVLRRRRVGSRRPVRPGHRPRQAGEPLHPAVHQPQLHRQPGRAAALLSGGRLEQARVGDRVVVPQR